MNRTKLMWILLVVSVMTNGVLLWRTMRHHGGGHHRQPKHRIIEQLSFDEAQCKAYEGLIAAHRQSISMMEEQLMQIRQSMYAGLGKTSAANDSLVAEVARIQAQMEQVHFTHFNAIRAICTAEQLPRFEALAPELPQLFSPKGPRR